MNKIPYEQRVITYTKALICYGKENQMIVALEELSECQKEICKALRGETNREHLIEEVADATIMLEQVQLIFDINANVRRIRDYKINRLKMRIAAAECKGWEDKTESGLLEE